MLTAIDPAVRGPVVLTRKFQFLCLLSGSDVGVLPSNLVIETTPFQRTGESIRYCVTSYERTGLVMGNEVEVELLIMLFRNSESNFFPENYNFIDFQMLMLEISDSK